MHQRFVQPAWATHFRDRLIIAQSTRLKGVSQAPHASLNLGLHTQDNDPYVLENRQLFCKDLGCDSKQLAGGFQVHGDQILLVEQPSQSEGYDAFITQTAGVVLSVTIADCTPVLLFDPIRQVIGAAHAGWRGTVAQIAGKTLQKMAAHFQTKPADCWAYIGACIGANDFEVDADVADHFGPKHKHYDANRNKFFVDLKQANKDQLLQVGVLEKQIEIAPFSTVADNDYFFSHRKEKGKTGRMLAVIGLK